MNGTLYLCATPIGNLSDISKRLKETLAEVDVIAAEDTRHTLKLLNHLGIKKRQISYFQHNMYEKGKQIIKLIQEGKNVALVTDAGTPAISDPGEELVALCAEEGIRVVAVPGPAAAICALIVSGLPTARFAFEGFLPARKRQRLERLEGLKNEDRTLIFYEAPHKLRNTLADMLEAFGNRRITLCREITKLHEETIRTTLEAAQSLYSEEKPPKGEYVLVLAPDENEHEGFWQGMSVSEHMQYYTSRGVPEREAMKNTARDRGVPKREIYSEVKVAAAPKRRDFT